MSIPHRKIHELNQKLASLTNELDHWRLQSEEGQPFEKHHSQIRLAAAQLDGERNRLQSELDETAADSDDTQVLTICRSMENSILELHGVWDYFRRKLMLRQMDTFREFLFAADEFAWACYEPPQLNVTSIPMDAVREPPLVFFGGSSTPLTASRTQRYCDQAFPGDATMTLRFVDIINSLPIPVISVPWFQIQHLPDALVIAHEVGHNVEFDFGLSETLQTALRESKLPEDRKAPWSAWCSEAFADYYGTLAAGPAFVETLIDFLSDSPDTVTTEAANPQAAYPPGWLRVELSLHAIRQTGFDNEADQLRDQWLTFFPERQDAHYAGDVEPAIEAFNSLKLSQFGDQTFSDMLSFSPSDLTTARDAASFLKSGQSDELQNYSVRTLLAAARIAFSDDAEKFTDDQLGKDILKQIPEKAGTRRSRFMGDPKTLQKREALARKAGVKLTSRH